MSEGGIEWRIRHARLKLMRQTETSECGLACLGMVANFHGSNLSLTSLRHRFLASARGANLRSLVRTADQLGLNARAVKLGLGDLKNLHVPAILHWDMNHFVVLEKVQGNGALIHDPQGRSQWMPLETVSLHFTGVALELRPAAEFTPINDNRRLRLSQLWQRLTGLKRALVQTLVLSLILQAFVIISPYYMQVAVDQALPALDRNLLAVLALGFALFTLFNTGAAFLRSYVLLSAGTTMSFGIAVNVARRLFRLPISWFEKRDIGDVISRFQSIQPIRQFLTEEAVASGLDGTLALFTLIVMLFYSVKLAAVAIAAFAIYGLLRAVSYAAQRSSQEDVLVTSAREQSAMIESLRGIATVRLFNSESERHAVWQSKLADTVSANVRLGKLTTFQQVGNGLIFGLEQVITVWLAIGMVIDGGFSIGMVFAYFAYRSQFLQKASSLVDHAIALRMLGLHLERLSDIALSQQDVSFTQTPSPARQLQGRIELKDVGFRYSTSDPWVLRGFNLQVQSGEHIAITGPSGGGKTTLVKIVLGLLQPEEGEVLIDGVPLAAFGYQNFRDHVGAVLQDDYVFSGSLISNIALFQDAPDLDLAAKATELAGLANDIERMPMGLDTLVGDGGSSLSGGQKQRLMLARALYRRPKLLVLDEGTAHLDPRLESLVSNSIAEIGITRFIVAHRLETVARADRILSIDGGVARDVTEEIMPLRSHVEARVS